jgi:prophage regulatory protein
MQNLIVRPKELKAIVGIGKTQAYAKIKAGDKAFDPAFPRPVKLGARSVGWRLDELQAWLASRNRGGAK